MSAALALFPATRSRKAEVRDGRDQAARKSLSDDAYLARMAEHHARHFTRVHHDGTDVLARKCSGLLMFACVLHVLRATWGAAKNKAWETIPERRFQRLTSEGNDVKHVRSVLEEAAKIGLIEVRNAGKSKEYRALPWSWTAAPDYMRRKPPAIAETSEPPFEPDEADDTAERAAPRPAAARIQPGGTAVINIRELRLSARVQSKLTRDAIVEIRANAHDQIAVVLREAVIMQQEAPPKKAIQTGGPPPVSNGQVLINKQVTELKSALSRICAKAIKRGPDPEETAEIASVLSSARVTVEQFAAALEHRVKVSTPFSSYRGVLLFARQVARAGPIDSGPPRRRDGPAAAPEMSEDQVRAFIRGD